MVNNLHTSGTRTGFVATANLLRHIQAAIIVYVYVAWKIAKCCCIHSSGYGLLAKTLCKSGPKRRRVRRRNGRNRASYIDV